MDYKDKEKQEAKEALKKIAKQEALAKIAPAKAKLKKMAKKSLSDLGVPKEAMALAGMLEAARRGKVRLKKGNFEVEGKYTPREKALKVLYKKDF